MTRAIEPVVTMAMHARNQGVAEHEGADLAAQHLAGILVVAKVLTGEDAACRSLVRSLGEGLKAAADARARVAQCEREAVRAERPIQNRGRRLTEGGVGAG